MNLIRKYKISKLLNKPLEGNEGEIISLIKYWLTDLYAVKLDKYPNSIFYFKGDKYVLEQKNDSVYIYVKWKDFWEVLETKYLMKGVDIQIILKFMIEEAFKQHVKTPACFSNKTSDKIEEAFKQHVKTPRPRPWCWKK
ncbi:MAG: hypothetical protein RLZZ546_1079 [Bacteroidota bacterium]